MLNNVVMRGVYSKVELEDIMKTIKMFKTKLSFVTHLYYG